MADVAQARKGAVFAIPFFLPRHQNTHFPYIFYVVNMYLNGIFGPRSETALDRRRHSA